MNIVDPETLFQRLDKTQQAVARALQLQAYALDCHGRKQHAQGNARASRTCTEDADALRIRLEQLLLSTWSVQTPPCQRATP